MTSRCMFYEYKSCPVIIPGPKIQLHCIFNEIYVNALTFDRLITHHTVNERLSAMHCGIQYYTLHILAQSYQCFMHTEKFNTAHRSERVIYQLDEV